MGVTKRKEAPLDPFKRALTLATRSIACDSAVEVVFTSEPPGLFGKTARVPEPSRVPTRSEIAVIRGHADAAALAVACHDPRLHATLAPSGGEARAVFEAIEQARVEAIGAKRMRGVSANLAARLEQHYERSRLNEVSDRSEAPLPEALALLVRERLTGLQPPANARPTVNLWRSWIEDRARQVLDRMPETLADQDAFGRLARDLLAALDLADQLDQSGNESLENQESEVDPSSVEAEGDDAEGRERAELASDAQADDDANGEEAVEDQEDGGADRLDGDSDAPEGPRRPEPWRPNLSVLDNPEAFGYKVFTRAFDEIVGAEDLCDVDELDRLRAF
ncbi:MAG: cobaltochelatase subunit CobT, partial [Methyloceanibacter sp.]